MNWQNLKDFTCPFCSKPLQHDTATYLINCTVCTFTITPERYAKIKKHRAGVKRSDIKMHWQNLLTKHCPATGHALRINEYGNTYTCEGDYCHFRITEQRLQEILGDKGHVAHHFSDGREYVP